MTLTLDSRSVDSFPLTYSDPVDWEGPMATATKARWQMSGQGYEFCNCDFGCGCNFGGFPNSKDGSCRFS
jgi:hypothetical protein